MRKTILVTGGAGFIGSNFLFYMMGVYPDYRFVCVDKLTYAGNLSTLKSILDKPNFRFIKADICDREAIYKVFEEEKPNVVVNFAAESHVDRSIENPGIFLETNILGTAVMMDACRKYGIERYHQVSTDEVYGDLPLDRPDLFFTETTPIHTSSPYSSSKASADLLVMAYHRTYGLPITISRCSNNYGPYQFPEKLIPLMIANCLADKDLPVYGEGLNVRDWLYVEDHNKAIDLIIHKGRVGEVYNIGGHNEMANIDIVKLICDALGKPYSLIQHVSDRKGHDMRYAIDPTKIHNELGWLPETKFADGIKKTIQWYRDNKDWWGEIVSGEYQKYYEKMYGKRITLYGGNMQKKLLILGGAGPHCKVVESAKEMGIYTIVADYLPDSPAKKIADESLMNDIYDIDDLVVYGEKNKIDGVLGFCLDPTQKPAQQIASRLGLPVFGDEFQVMSLTDKGYFKALCKKADVDTIPEYSETDLNAVEYPCLVKPGESRGSRGITVCRNQKELIEAISFAKSVSNNGACIIEKYMADNQDLTISYIVKDGEPTLISLGDRYPGREEDNLNRQLTCTIQPSRFADMYLKNVDDKIKRMIKILGIKNGPVFFQGFVDGNTVRLYDPGIRFPGNEYERIYKEATGIDPMKSIIS